MVAVLPFLLLCLCTPLTEGRWPRAARPVARVQERRIPSLAKSPPRPRVQRWNYPQQNRVSRLPGWRSSQQKPQKSPGWEGHQFALQDNRWNPLFGLKPQDQSRLGPRELQGPPQVPRPQAGGWQDQGWPRNPSHQGPHTGSVHKTDTAPSLQPPLFSSYPAVTNSVTSYPANLHSVSNYPANPNTVTGYPAHPTSIRRIDTGVVEDGELAEIQEIPDIHLAGLTIYKFRGEDGMAGYVPPSSLPIRWSEASLPPRVTHTPPPPLEPPNPPHAQLPIAVTRTPKVPAPPFPTRHTTHRPDQDQEPVVIIAQSSVQKN